MNKKLVDEINNIFCDELKDNEHLEEELVKEIRDLINGNDNVNDLMKIIEKYSK